LKQCPNCRANLADFVPSCPYCGVATPVPRTTGSSPARALPPQNSIKALFSLICGVLFLFPPTALVAVVLGHAALADIKKSAGWLTGQGLAVAGLVMGYVGIGAAAIFLVAVAFVLRSTLRQDVPGNEAAAIETMKTYRTAMVLYKVKCPERGFPDSLPRLGPGSGDCQHANLIDGRLAVRSPAKLGYQFLYQPGVHGQDKVTAFALVARPVMAGSTGRRYFYLDEALVIRQSNSQVVGRGSEPLEGGAESPADEENESQPFRLVGGGGFGERRGFGELVGLGGDRPTRRIAENPADQLSVQCMTGFVSLDPAEQGQTEKGQVPDQVERFVATELVGKAKRAVHHAVLGQDDGVFERSSANQTHGAQRLDVALETKGAGAGQQVPEGARFHEHLDLLLADERVREVHITLDPEFIGRIDADAAVLLDDLHRLYDLQIPAAPAQAARAGLFEQAHERLGRTVENRDLDRVDVDKDVVEAGGIDRGKQVFGGREQHALLHQAGGIADPGHVPAARLDRELVQVGAAENDS
jgi:hypothetical protein